MLLLYPLIILSSMTLIGVGGILTILKKHISIPYMIYIFYIIYGILILRNAHNKLYERTINVEYRFLQNKR